MSPKQKKLAAKAPPPNKINEKDFAVLRAEKAKGRGMGLQDESVKPGKVMKARVGKSIKKDPTKTVNPFEKKSSKFMERRKKLAGVKSLAGKAGRLGIAIGALGAAGAGAAKLGQTIGRKMSEKKDKKMGGGMMKKYSKGGGSDTSKTKNKKMPKAIAQGKTKKVMIHDMMPADTAMRTGSPMPKYSKGIMVKARGCKLGRTRPTKIT